MIILNAKQSDLDEILEIEEESFSEPWSKSGMEFEIDSDDTYVPIVRDKGEMFGYLVLHCFGDEAELFRVAVRKKYRNMKIATKLLISAQKFAQRNGIEKIFLEVRQSNINAIKLYTSGGFEKLGVRKNYYENPKEDAIIMVCNTGRGEGK